MYSMKSRMMILLHLLLYAKLVFCHGDNLLLPSSLSSFEDTRRYPMGESFSSSGGMPSHFNYHPSSHKELVENVTTQIGQPAFLPCKVKQIGNKSVSWVRKRDGHIITVDRTVFIPDQRFQALKQPDGFWTLQIKYVQARDAGSYECQVSIEPKISTRVHLQVVVPRTEILGQADRYIKADSNVVIRCIVKGALEAPSYIIWYNASRQLHDDIPGIHTELDTKSPDQTAIGTLIIEKVKKRDTGNYTCSPSNSPSATVTLNVINGESSASAVTSAATKHRPYANIAHSIMVLTLISTIIYWT
ncbi:hypothetical protein ACFFRR_000467 [Megaselia abdita]